MSEAKPDFPPRPATASASSTSTSTTALPPSSAARQRLSSRNSQASPSPRPDPRLRRRSSLISYSSVEDLRRTVTEDIINPRTSNDRNTTAREDNGLTHWDSSPLAFAILPAIGGLLFKNGSAYVTDFLLLVLAAIFMNWSIRLPWDWYFSAQALKRDLDDVDDELDDEIAVEEASSAGGSPKPTSERRRDTGIDVEPPVQSVPKREEAEAQLRQQETLALCATFVFPVLAAFLLHVIREQLSRPSTTLVSDYNLSIFLLAAEIRPVRQIVRLVAKRTLHLQRTVTGIDDPFLSTLEGKSATNSLVRRIEELESRLADHKVVPQSITMAEKTDVSDLSTEIKKRYEPRLEGLERAVRRYEKRSTTMAINTEQRLLQLEERLQEALSLAAVAAKYSQDRGIFATILEKTSRMIALAMKATLDICLLPFRMVDSLYLKIKAILLGPMPPRSAKRKGGKHEGVNGSKEDPRPRDKTPLRKIVR